MAIRTAKFRLGQVVKHRLFPFRGVIFDVDPEFADAEEWWSAIPENVRPPKEQPFYRLLADYEEGCCLAYVSEQNLLADTSGEPIGHPYATRLFDGFECGAYLPKSASRH